MVPILVIVLPLFSFKENCISTALGNSTPVIRSI
nr:MAG TPA: hypothetical protein [Caudoviricetes sp.]